MSLLLFVIVFGWIALSVIVSVIVVSHSVHDIDLHKVLDPICCIQIRWGLGIPKPVRRHTP